MTNIEPPDEQCQQVVCPRNFAIRSAIFEQLPIYEREKLGMIIPELATLHKTRPVRLKDIKFQFDDRTCPALNINDGSSEYTYKIYEDHTTRTKDDNLETETIVLPGTQMERMESLINTYFINSKSMFSAVHLEGVPTRWIFDKPIEAKLLYVDLMLSSGDVQQLKQFLNTVNVDKTNLIYMGLPLEPIPNIFDGTFVDKSWGDRITFGMVNFNIEYILSLKSNNVSLLIFRYSLSEVCRNLAERLVEHKEVGYTANIMYFHEEDIIKSLTAETGWEMKADSKRLFATFTRLDREISLSVGDDEFCMEIHKKGSIQSLLKGTHFSYEQVSCIFENMPFLKRHAIGKELEWQKTFPYTFDSVLIDFEKFEIIIDGNCIGRFASVSRYIKDYIKNPASKMRMLTIVGFGENNYLTKNDKKYDKVRINTSELVLKYDGEYPAQFFRVFIGVKLKKLTATSRECIKNATELVADATTVMYLDEPQIVPIVPIANPVPVIPVIDLPAERLIPIVNPQPREPIAQIVSGVPIANPLPVTPAIDPPAERLIPIVDPQPREPITQIVSGVPIANPVPVIPAIRPPAARLIPIVNPQPREPITQFVPGVPIANPIPMTPAIYPPAARLIPIANPQKKPDKKRKKTRKPVTQIVPRTVPLVPVANPMPITPAVDTTAEKLIPIVNPQPEEPMTYLEIIVEASQYWFHFFLLIYIIWNIILPLFF